MMAKLPGRVRLTLEHTPGTAPSTTSILHVLYKFKVCLAPVYPCCTVFGSLAREVLEWTSMCVHVSAYMCVCVRVCVCVCMYLCVYLQLMFLWPVGSMLYPLSLLAPGV